MQSVKLIATLRGHAGFIGRIAWSPDGAILATPSEDQSIRLWSTETWKCLAKLDGHQGDVYCVAFHPNGEVLASGSADGTVKLWNVATSELIGTLNWNHGSVNSLAFDSSGVTLAVGGDHSSIALWHVAEQKLVRRLNGRQDVVNCISFDPTGGALVSAGIDGTIQLWDVASGELVRTFKGHADSVNSVVFEPSGRRIISGGADGTIRIWDSVSGRVCKSVLESTDKIRDVAVSPDGQHMAAKCQDDCIRIWENETFQQVHLMTEPATPGQPTSLAFHPFLPYLASVGSDPNSRTDELIHIWQVPSRGLNDQDIKSELTATRVASRAISPDEVVAESPGDDSDLLRWAGDQRVTLAIAFTDIVGFTKLGNELRDERSEQVRQAHFTRGRQLIEPCKGLVVKTIGDSLLAVFRSVERALEFAIKLHQDPGSSQVEIRAGIHIGPVSIVENDVFGHSVNYAARVIGTAVGAEIRLSDDAKRDLDKSGKQQHAQLKWIRHDNVSLNGFPGVSTLWELDLN